MFPGLLHHARRFLIRGAYSALVCRLLIPVGYMPAELAGGSPVMLCPSGMPSTLQAAHGHAATSPHDEQAQAREHCPFGMGAGQAPLAMTIELAVAPMTGEPDHATLQSEPRSTTAYGLHPRGPPISISF